MENEKLFYSPIDPAYLAVQPALSRLALNSTDTFSRVLLQPENLQHFTEVDATLPTASSSLGEKAVSVWRRHTMMRSLVGYLCTGALLSSPSPVFGQEQHSDGGYPYAGAPVGTLDKWGAPTGECASYVYWRESTNGVSDKHFGILEFYTLEKITERAKALDIRVDQVPAPGAAIFWPTQNHVAYIEGVNGTQLDLSDYNGFGGVRTYGRATYATTDVMPGGIVVHFEDPVETDDRFDTAMYNQILKDTLKTGQTMSRETYLKSQNGDFRLLLTKNGNAELYDANLDKIWESNTDNKHVDYMAIEPASKKGKLNYLTFKTARSKLVKRVSIGSGNVKSIKLTDEGNFSAFKGAHISKVIAPKKRLKK